MPNWCYNALTVSGPRGPIVLFQTMALGEEAFSLQSLLPCPQSLYDVPAGSHEDLYEIVHGDWEGVRSRKVRGRPMSPYTTREEMVRDLPRIYPDTNDAVGIANQYKDNLEEHGHRTWYGWCVDSWGTKWDVSNAVLISESAGSLTYEFSSAWTPPEEAIRTISKSFHELTFKLEYYEPGCDFVGSATFIKGKVTERIEGAISNPEDRITFEHLLPDWILEEPEEEDEEIVALSPAIEAVEEDGI